MTLKNFLVLDSSLAGTEAGGSVIIAGSEGHHGAKVMRLAVGENVLVTDAFGFQAEATVSAVSKSDFTVNLLEAPRESAAPSTRFVLVQALAKGGRDEAALETATELGVDAVVPWQADRSIVQWRAEKADKGLQKWRSTVYAAVKQSRRVRIPEVHEVATTKDLVGHIEEAVGKSGHVFVLHESALTRFADRVHELMNAGASAPEIWVVVGPEGGISDAEAQQLEAAGAECVLLGQEILRASSAGPAALSALCFAFGRWS